MQQVEEQYSILKDQMRRVDNAISFYSKDGLGSHFTLAEATMAPFVQRCCGSLPEPYDPVSIAEELDLRHLQAWIQLILRRESVQSTAPSGEVENKRIKLVKRLARIGSRAS